MGKKSKESKAKKKEESKKKLKFKLEKKPSKKKSTSKKGKEEVEEEIPVVSKEIKDESKKRKYNYMTSRTKISNEDCPDFLEGKCKKLFCDKIHNYSKIYKK